MGSNPYFYFTPYRKDLQAALEDLLLRQREFKAGRYDPAMQAADPPSYMFQFDFPPDDMSPAAGARHSSIEAAMNAGAESGTRSILDITRIADEPDYSAACPLSSGDLMELLGTTQPTRDLIERVLVGGSHLGGLSLGSFGSRLIAARVATSSFMKTRNHMRSFSPVCPGTEGPSPLAAAWPSRISMTTRRSGADCAPVRSASRAGCGRSQSYS
jgi:hypothetical protein